MRAEFRRHVFDERVEDDAVAACGRHRCIGLQFGQHMVMRMVGVQADQHALGVPDQVAHLLNDIRGDARSLDHRDQVAHRVGFDRLPIMCTDINIHTDDPAVRDARHQRRFVGLRVAVVKHRQHRRAQDERTAMRDARFHDHIGPRGPDDLLHGMDILRVLDDRAAQPLEVVGVGAGHAGLDHPCKRIGCQGLVFSQALDVALHFILELCDCVHGLDSLRSG
ncbi:hypothetical protein D3C71_1534320 [compost metagenome]